MVHLPRWEELPVVDLYKEQVLELIEHVLSPLEIRPVSAAMINNYTKLHWIPAPIQKKYSRKHVSHILVIAMLKDVFELSEINRAIQLEKSLLGMNVAYDLFITEMENALDLSQNGMEGKPISLDTNIHAEQRMMRFAAMTYAFHRSSRQLMFNQPTQGEKI